MSDARMSAGLARTNPVPGQRMDFPGVALQLMPPMARASLRARSAATVAQFLGAEVPQTVGTFVGSVACLGPDEWVFRSVGSLPTLPDSSTGVAMTEISDRSICLVVEGPQAARLLMSGCPIDLDRFDIGRATRTVYETVEILIFRTGAERFEVEVWRSFAPWLWAALSKAAVH
jgi:sarcosine oxidase, subunit gamma